MGQYPLTKHSRDYSLPTIRIHQTLQGDLVCLQTYSERLASRRDFQPPLSYAYVFVY